MKSVYIYALKDPRDGKVRYIGKANNPEFRLREHIRKAHNRRCYSQHWIMGLRAEGLSLALEVLDEVPADKWEFFEAAYVRVYRESGAKLTNETEGGDGGSTSSIAGAKISAAQTGKRFSPERCAAMSAIRMGTKHSPEHREKISAALRGKKKSPEHCERLSAVNRGKTLSAEHRSKLSAAKVGKKLSPEHRANIGAALLGKKHSSERILRAKSRKDSDETRRKKSLSRLGMKFSEDHCLAISAAQRGKKHSPEHKAKISAGLSAHYEKLRLSGWKRKNSLEVRLKISKTLTGKKQSAETIAKRVAKTTGQKRSLEVREKMSAAQREIWRQRNVL